MFIYYFKYEKIIDNSKNIVYSLVYKFQSKFKNKKLISIYAGVAQW